MQMCEALTWRFSSASSARTWSLRWKELGTPGSALRSETGQPMHHCGATLHSLDFHCTSFFELRFSFLLCSATFLVTFARVRVF